MSFIVKLLENKKERVNEVEFLDTIFTLPVIKHYDIQEFAQEFGKITEDKAKQSIVDGGLDPETLKKTPIVEHIWKEYVERVGKEIAGDKPESRYDQMVTTRNNSILIAMIGLNSMVKPDGKKLVTELPSDAKKRQETYDVLVEEVLSNITLMGDLTSYVSGTVSSNKDSKN